jgi:oligopeptide transport system substrate-binding protein
MSGWGNKCSGLLVALLLLAGCGQREAVAPPSGSAQVLRLSQRNEPADLDPATATLPDEFSLLRALSEGLLIPGPNGGPPLPGAAERFEVSADGLTYTFHLRARAQWTNSDPVTAADFVESYRRLLTPSTAAPKASVFFAVKNARAFVSGEITDFSAVGFRAPDARTLVVTLAQPSPRFPHYVASGPWIPVNPRVVARHGRAWTRAENFVGNGAFTLAEWRPHQHIVVKRNPAWQGAAGVRLAEIRFVHFDNEEAEDRAYRANQIDATMAVPRSKLDAYAQERPAEVHRAPMIETRYLAFNTQRPPLNDERVRRALALAIDRRTIAERILRGGQLPADRLVPPALRPDLPGSPAEFRYDPVAARQMLAATGLDPKNFPRLELSAWSQSQVPVLEAVQAMWREALGIETAIATRDGKVHFNALATGDYDIGFITAIPDVADAANLLVDFVTGVPENYPRWSDAGFDAAFRQALTLADPAAQAKTLHEAENRLLQAAPVAPLYFNTKIWLMSPRVRGWQEDGLWGRAYAPVFLDTK